MIFLGKRKLQALQLHYLYTALIFYALNDIVVRKKFLMGHFLKHLVAVFLALFSAFFGVAYDLSERFYLTSEIRNSSQTGLELAEEGGAGRFSDSDYQPLTLALGLGVRF